MGVIIGKGMGNSALGLEIWSDRCFGFYALAVLVPTLDPVIKFYAVLFYQMEITVE